MNMNEMDNEQMNDMNEAQDTAPEASDSTRPLERIEVEPAENGVVVTHHPRLKDSVKGLDVEGARPKRHVFQSHEDAAEHVKKNIKRLS